MSTDQFQRIEQLMVQSQIDKHGLYPIVALGSVGKEVGITSDQRRKLKQAEDRERTRLYNEIAKLLEASRKRVLAESLDDVQVLMIQEILGEPLPVEEGADR